MSRHDIPQHFITHNLAQEGPVTTTDFLTPAPTQPKPKNTAATAALVLGIIGLVLVVIPGLNAGLGIAAIITAAVGLSKAKRVRAGQAKAAVGLALGIVTMLGAFFALVSAADSAEPQVTVTQQEGPGIDEPDEPKSAAEPAPEPEVPSMTVSQEQAIISADGYLYGLGGFSRESLIGQLEFEGFSTEDAAFAVDYLDPNWNQQAIMSAQSYLEMGGFSRQSLIDQLLYEGFTPDQAESAVQTTGL